MLIVKARKAADTIFKVFGMTRDGQDHQLLVIFKIRSSKNHGKFGLLSPI